MGWVLQMPRIATTAAASGNAHFLDLSFDAEVVQLIPLAFDWLCRVPMVEGGDMDYGHDGKLLVCDATGTHLVDNRWVTTV